jgi:hypothetical protein
MAPVGCAGLIHSVGTVGKVAQVQQLAQLLNLGYFLFWLKALFISSFFRIIPKDERNTPPFCTGFQLIFIVIPIAASQKGWLLEPQLSVDTCYPCWDCSS